MKKLLHITAFVVASFLVSGCAVRTATYGTGESVERALANDLASIATFGRYGGKNQLKDVTYQDRAPLVTPSKEQFAIVPPPGSSKIVAPAPSPDSAIAAAEGEAGTTANQPENTPSVTLKELEASRGTDTLKRKKKKVLGLGKDRDTTVSSNSLIEVPSEYRVVEGSAPTKTVDELISGKEKKKKRFGLF